MSNGQVVVFVRGGIAYAWTHNDIDIVHVDWDEFDDNRPTDERIAEMREEIERIGNDEDRIAALEEIDGRIEKIRSWEAQLEDAAAAKHAAELDKARALLAAEEDAHG